MKKINQFFTIFLLLLLSINGAKSMSLNLIEGCSWIRATWSSVPGAVFYEYSISPGGDGTTTNTNRTFHGLTSWTTYTVCIKAYDINLNMLDMACSSIETSVCTIKGFGFIPIPLKPIKSLLRSDMLKIDNILYSSNMISQPIDKPKILLS